MTGSTPQPQDKYVLRLPEGLRAEIKSSARDNSRSMNAEIVSRIEAQQAGLRDHIATAALNGMLAHATRYRPYEKDRGLHWHEAISIEAYELADAMLKAREGGQ